MTKTVRQIRAFRESAAGVSRQLDAKYISLPSRMSEPLPGHSVSRVKGEGLLESKVTDTSVI